MNTSVRQLIGQISSATIEDIRAAEEILDDTISEALGYEPDDVSNILIRLTTILTAIRSEKEEPDERD